MRSLSTFAVVRGVAHREAFRQRVAELEAEDAKRRFQVSVNCVLFSVEWSKTAQPEFGSFCLKLCAGEGAS